MIAKAVCMAVAVWMDTYADWHTDMCIDMRLSWCCGTIDKVSSKTVSENTGGHHLHMAASHAVGTADMCGAHLKVSAAVHGDGSVDEMANGMVLKVRAQVPKNEPPSYRLINQPTSANLQLRKRARAAQRPTAGQDPRQARTHSRCRSGRSS